MMPPRRGRHCGICGFGQPGKPGSTIKYQQVGKKGHARFNTATGEVEQIRCDGERSSGGTTNPLGRLTHVLRLEALGEPAEHGPDEARICLQITARPQVAA